MYVSGRATSQSTADPLPVPDGVHQSGRPPWVQLHLPLNSPWMISTFLGTAPLNSQIILNTADERKSLLRRFISTKFEGGTYVSSGPGNWTACPGIALSSIIIVFIIITHPPPLLYLYNNYSSILVSLILFVGGAAPLPVLVAPLHPSTISSQKIITVIDSLHCNLHPPVPVLFLFLLFCSCIRRN